MDVLVEPIGETTLLELFGAMSREDLVEVYALGLDPVWATLHSIRNSEESWAGWYRGELICVFGVSSSGELAPTYHPWLLGTDRVSKASRAFLPLSRQVLGGWSSRYGALDNYVDCRHLKAIRWLKWLGFTLEPPAPHGLHGRPFHHFYLEAPACVSTQSLC